MRSARDAIVESAMDRFAVDGFGTPLRAIAEGAGVSAALIVHHFGSKAGLRDAVDAHVVGLVEEKLRLFNEEGPGAAAAMVLAVLQKGLLPRYLARVLVEGGSAADGLFTTFASITERALADLDIADPGMAAALLVTHSLGMMALADRVEAATGVAPFSPEGLPRVVVSMVSIYGGALAPMLPELPEVVA